MLMIADFETTVLEDTQNQEETEVWAYGLATLFDRTDDVIIGNSIESFFNELTRGRKRDKRIVYFVNLKFDGSFILDYLVRSLNFVSAFNQETKEFKKDDELKPGELTYVITDLGIWYLITVNYKGYIIEFRDTLKILPFSVEMLSKAFDTRAKKLDLEYKGERHAHGVITMQEREYLANDIRVPKEALEKFLTEIGATLKPPLTIAQAALKDFMKKFTKTEFDKLFPNLAEYYGGLDPEEFKNKYASANADEYIRRSYYGGWCYANEKYTGTIRGEIETYDINSLYPFEMENLQNVWPVGYPTFTKDPMFLKHMTKDNYFIIRFRCKFTLHEDCLPFIQLKYDYNYRSNENLRTSYFDRFGHYRRELKPTLTLTSTTFKMFIKCYHVEEFEFLDACYFTATERGLFNSYVNKWREKKIEASIEGNVVKRTIAKLFLNSLYGRFGRNPVNNFKLASDICEEEAPIDYELQTGKDNKPLYIPIATAITSYARAYTVTCANYNYDYFRYSDTDSIHLELPKGVKPNNLKIDDNEFGAWKLESVNDHGIFLRQKTYMEYTGDDYDIKACGMPERCKMLLAENMKGNMPQGNILITENRKKYKLSDKEVKFFYKNLSPENFDRGLSVPGKLLPRVIKGGTVLIEVDFTII